MLSGPSQSSSSFPPLAPGCCRVPASHPPAFPSSSRMLSGPSQSSSSFPPLAPGCCRVPASHPPASPL
ncbi:hypothetical protein CesoFtcFv8_016880 [Champsocephalus esox]|uniref:Uncharacterized protein n=1 Tax=Champsocephalus esox TaxID=159716 RepID=A0AAN8BIK0_9TELE|nr:hypothetical protein CesoFtcFv8_016880 [Champsocephalus esox]